SGFGPSSSTRSLRTSKTFESMTPSHHLYQHRTALPAADAFGGDAASVAKPLHGVDEVQHDAVARSADGMAEADRAAIDVESGTVDRAGRTVEAEHLATEFFILPRGEAAEHLGGERFVELPSLDVMERELVALQQLGRRQH